MSEEVRVSNLDATPETWQEDGTIIVLMVNQANRREMIAPDRPEWPQFALDALRKGWTPPKAVEDRVSDLRAKSREGEDDD